MSKRLMGQTLDVYWTVADTRMLLTLGKDAKTRLTAIAAGKAPAEPNKAVADAQAAAVARDLFYYVDLTPVLSVVGSLTEEQRLAALGKGGGNPIPVVFTAGGDGAGKLWTVDLTVPPAAFAGIGIAGRRGHRRPVARGSLASLAHHARFGSLSSLRRARGARSLRRLSPSSARSSRTRAATISAPAYAPADPKPPHASARLRAALRPRVSRVPVYRMAALALEATSRSEA